MLALAISQFLVLFFLYINIESVSGRACPIDTSPCIDDQLYTFYVCAFPVSQGACTEDVSQSFLTGTFDRKDGVFTDGDLKYEFTEDCTDFEMPTPGFIGTVALNTTADPVQCYGIYGAVYLGGLEWGQFVGEYVPPTPMPTPAPTGAPTSTETIAPLIEDDVCDFTTTAEALDCPDLSKCHRGNWTLSFCGYDCDAEDLTSCKSTLAEDTLVATLDWGLGLQWFDDEYYEYEVDCRKWSVPELKIEGYFMGDTDDDTLCDIMTSGVWAGGLMSGVKTSDLPSESGDSSLGGLQLGIAVGGSICLAVVGVLIYMLFNNWRDSKSNKAIATEVYELPDAPPADIPPPYMPYYVPQYDPSSMAQAPIDGSSARPDSAAARANNLTTIPENEQVVRDMGSSTPPQTHTATTSQDVTPNGNKTLV